MLQFSCKRPIHTLPLVLNFECRFLPKLAAAGLQKELVDAEIHIQTDSDVLADEIPRTCEVKDGSLMIGQTIVSVHSPDNQTKVPDVVFYDTPQVRVVLLICNHCHQYLQNAGIISCLITL